MKKSTESKDCKESKENKKANEISYLIALFLEPTD